MQNQTQTLLLAATLCATAAATAQTPSHLVVPWNGGYETIDAMSYEWIAGATDNVRQQTLIGHTHLDPTILNRDIHAIELRRTAVDEDYLAGSMNLTVTLSTSPRTPLMCDNVWANNVGQDAVQVFSGQVTLPASPAVPGGTGSAVAWTPNNTLRIAFSQPFHYAGGTLCVDVTGQPIAGQKTWWMADAIEDVIPGTATVDLGPGCGIYGGPQREWSLAAARSMVPGGRAIFRAEGPPNGLTFAMFGPEASAPMFPVYPPLTQWGIPTPGCVAYVNPTQLLAVVPAIFQPETHPLSSGAIAEVLVHLPTSPAWFGFQLTTQWFDMTQLASSNGIKWTVGGAAPTLDMALCEGDPSQATGNVTTYLAHVMRFEYQ